jgi:hypothetical protein
MNNKNTKNNINPIISKSDKLYKSPDSILNNKKDLKTFFETQQTKKSISTEDNQKQTEESFDYHDCLSEDTEVSEYNEKNKNNSSIFLPVSENAETDNEDSIKTEEDDDDDEDYELESGHSLIDSSGIFSNILYLQLLDSYSTNKQKVSNTNDRILCIIKATEYMLEKEGINKIKMYRSLAEVVTTAEMNIQMNSKMQGYDAKTKSGEMVELKDSRVNIGSKVNVNFRFKEIPAKNAKEYYALYREDTIKNKGTKVSITHNFSGGKCNNYIFLQEFILFYAEAKDMYNFDTKKTVAYNIGGVSCKECTKVHRLIALLEMQTIWEKEFFQNKSNNLWRDKALKAWLPKFCEKISQRCQ